MLARVQAWRIRQLERWTRFLMIAGFWLYSRMVSYRAKKMNVYDTKPGGVSDYERYKPHSRRR